MDTTVTTTDVPSWDRWRQSVQEARDSMTVRRVFGEPIERDGSTIIPAAFVFGGGGGGGGGDNEGNGGGGTGFGLRARPVGAFVVRDGEVRWEPALDVTRLAILGQVVAIVALLSLRSILRGRAKRR
jgi:uncharacterized spore protein YtfJ